MGFEARGSGGALLVGYQKAATLSSWSLKDQALAFVVEKLDPVWSRKPITGATLQIGRSTWRCSIESADLAAGAARVSGLTT